MSPAPASAFLTSKSRPALIALLAVLLALGVAAQDPGNGQAGNLPEKVTVNGTRRDTKGHRDGVPRRYGQE